MNDTNSAHSAPIPSRKSRFHKRRSEDERRGWVKRFERSGQKLKEFCQQHGLAVSSLYLWRRQISPTNATSSRHRDRGRLMEVAIPAVAPIFSSNTATAAIVHLPNGVRIELSPHTDTVWLSQLIQMTCGLERGD